MFVRFSDGWLMNGIEEQKNTFPRHLVFCSSVINDCAKENSIFVSHFGRRYELVNMYHSKTNESVKQAIGKTYPYFDPHKCGQHGHQIQICS